MTFVVSMRSVFAGSRGRNQICCGRAGETKKPGIVGFVFQVHSRDLVPCGARVTSASRHSDSIAVGISTFCPSKPMGQHRSIWQYLQRGKVRPVDEPVLSAGHRFGFIPCQFIPSGEPKCMLTIFFWIDPGQIDRSVGSFREKRHSALIQSWRIVRLPLRKTSGVGKEDENQNTSAHLNDSASKPKVVYLQSVPLVELEKEFGDDLLYVACTSRVLRKDIPCFGEIVYENHGR